MFINLAQEATQIFTLEIENKCKKIAGNIVNNINTILKRNPEMPDFWMNDMRAIVNTLNYPNPKLFLSDITKDNKENKMAIFQKWMHLNGQLLKEWHKLFSKNFFNFL